MCGIIAGISNKDINKNLISGLKILEYRGYDSAGIAILSKKNKIYRAREVGKVVNLEDKINKRKKSFVGNIGIGHTRWATHGKPSNINAHPHISNNSVAVVHNGIIENYLDLKKIQKEKNYNFSSETDSEIIAHEIHLNMQKEETLLESVRKAIKKLKGAYALAVMCNKFPDTLIATRKNSNLIIGIGEQENYIASDVIALTSITNKFILLEEGDIAQIKLDSIDIYDEKGNKVTREIKTSKIKANEASMNDYKCFMQKEIFEQPKAIEETLATRIIANKISLCAFGYDAPEIFKKIKQVQIVACGTSYHAGIVAKYWFEDIAKLPCNIEVASEYRYRNPILLDDTLFVTISQSGETADTLAALKAAKKINNKIHTLCICNNAESNLTRESKLNFLTKAGAEISVASTKSFTTQLVALALLVTAVGVSKKTISKKREELIAKGMKKLPELIKIALNEDEKIKQLAKKFKNKTSAIFIGRGTMHAIAMEGALKLKETSYIHAGAYPAGELKHGPIALIDKNIPVIAIAPNDDLLDKLKSNLEEIKSRGSQMIVFEDEKAKINPIKAMKVIPVTSNLGRITAPIIFTIPLQLLSYHVAIIKGLDVDKPRNLAKSVTVE